MARPLSKLAISILKALQTQGLSNLSDLHGIENENAIAVTAKQLYNTVYRLKAAELIRETRDGLSITEAGQEVIHTKELVRDGIWKLIVFDIPESQRQVRTFLRQKLRELGFKKWQNSIWVSPFLLDPGLEQELRQLAEQYFIRLIKTTDINYVKDLEELFDTNPPKT